MHTNLVLAIVAVVELLSIAALTVSRSRTSPRERLLQRDNERLQALNTDLLDRTMHAVERTWTPPPHDLEPARRELVEDEGPEVLLDVGETGFEDDPLYIEAMRAEARQREREARDRISV